MLDRSGVPFPPKEPQAPSSAASSGINPAASEYMTDVSRSPNDINRLKKTDAEHIKVVAETTLKLELVEIDMAHLRAEQKRREEVHLKEVQDKDKHFEESQTQINELELVVESLRDSIELIKNSLNQK